MKTISFDSLANQSESSTNLHEMRELHAMDELMITYYYYFYYYYAPSAVLQ